MTNVPNRVNKTTYKTEYPFNRVMMTRSGHEIHWDDSPGSERIRIAHKDGTYWEISPGGKSVTYTVGSRQDYNKSGVTITVDENHDIKIAGHQRVNVGGGSKITVAGDADLVVGGSAHTVVGGNMRSAVAGDLQLAVAGSGNIHI